MNRTLLLSILLTMLCIQSYGQFNQQPTALKLEAKSDSITVATIPTLNMQTYNEAYDEYLRKLRFKQRNKIIIKNTGINITQAAFDNWAPGGNNSLSGRAFIHAEHIYTAPTFSVHSIFEGALSFISSDKKIQKSEDYWNLNIKPNWKIAPKWELSGDLLVKSQFAQNFRQNNDNTTTLTSSFMAPGQFNLSAGITYAPPKKKLSIYFAPISGNLQMVLNKELAEQGLFGMEPGQQFKPGFGALFRVIYNEKFAKNKIEYYSKLESFWNYDSDPTIWWENKLTFKFTNLFGANFYLLTKYDRNEKPPLAKEGGGKFWDYVQLNESFGLGLVVNFQSKTPKQYNSQYVKPSGRKRRN